MLVFEESPVAERIGYAVGMSASFLFGSAVLFTVLTVTRRVPFTATGYGFVALIVLAIGVVGYACKRWFA